MRRFFSAVIGVFCVFFLNAQDSIPKISTKYLDIVGTKAGELSDKLNKKSNRALGQLQKQEDKIKRKLTRLDSSKAKEIFANSQSKYDELRNKLENPGSASQYIPYLDTITTSLKFLDSNRPFLQQTGNVDGRLGNALSNLSDLKTSFNKAADIKKFIKERREYFKEQLKNLPFAKQLKKLNKQAHYYSAQINEYKSILKDSKKIERKALELLTQTKQFHDFLKKNSQLASLFGYSNPTNLSAASGLQTTGQINQLIQSRFGTTASVSQILQQQITAAQTPIQALKDKAGAYASGSYGNSSEEMEMPDFKSNDAKTKSFFRRLEYGGNVQSQKAKKFFPVTTDIAVTLGYKINNKSTAGISASYKLGLGKGWNAIKFSNEGIGLRSFIDYKLKGSLFISGGYEQNYRTAFYSIEQLQNLTAWQSSGLLGLTKKYNVSKKIKGSVQLLWDFLSYRQIPKSQEILFRVGYTLK